MEVAVRTVRNSQLWIWLKTIAVPRTVYLFERPDLLNPTFQFYVGSGTGRQATQIGTRPGVSMSNEMATFIRTFNEGADGTYLPVEDKYGCVEVSFRSFRRPVGAVRLTYGDRDIDYHLGYQPTGRRVVQHHGRAVPRPLRLKILRSGADSRVDVLDHDGSIWTFRRCQLIITYNDGMTDRDRYYVREMNEIIILPDGGILLISG